jgi:serine/threonine-protein kinase RsbW
MQIAQAIERPGTTEHLAAFLDFIQDSCRRAGTDEQVSSALRLAVEEVCMDLIHHGYAGMPPGPITIEFVADPDRITLTICDRARPFDPRDLTPPDLTLDWRRRSVGGLGWHLVKQMIDEIAYCSDPSTGNRLTLVKHNFAQNRGR